MTFAVSLLLTVFLRHVQHRQYHRFACVCVCVQTYLYMMGELRGRVKVFPFNP